MAGRPKQPAAAHVANGNKSMLSKAEIEARQVAEDAIKPASDNVVCPTWLDAVGKKMWHSIMDELSAVDLITNVDVYALALACDAYSKYVKSSKDIKKDGLVLEHKNAIGAVNKVANPSVAIAQKYATQFKSYCSEFGLSPAARARLARPKDDDEDDEDDDLD
ncbi:phage terminase small subunit P27 family [Paenibacillus frigoriresistens]|uniref:phage terminase small subunit P27 family n=1 Tax=Paenibacillus alginolyticus TaxID=59839 RepID=UPI00156775CE|nr:phage terminase small subunit P27 family [Paenibacillus frigoriresistens]NRF91543.1 phage terminase small subunit P27 family [Paenibacillus frigoriresistens]